MRAFSLWKGTSFCLLEYLSVVSTMRNTSADPIEIFYDDADPPQSPYWDHLDRFSRVAKRPATKLLVRYIQTHCGQDAFLPPYAAVLADLFRYCELYERGGLWFDLDCLHVKDICGLVQDRDMVFGFEDPSVANNALLYFSAHHPVLVEILRRLPDRLSQGPMDYVVIGPPFLSDVLRELDRLHFGLPMQTFYPISYRDGDRVVFGQWPLTADTWSIHVWGRYNRKVFLGKSLMDFEGRRSTVLDLARDLLDPPAGPGDPGV